MRYHTGYSKKLSQWDNYKKKERATPWKSYRNIELGEILSVIFTLCIQMWYINEFEKHVSLASV